MKNLERIYLELSVIVFFTLCINNVMFSEQLTPLYEKLEAIHKIKVPEPERLTKVWGTEKIELFEDGNYWVARSAELELIVEKSTGTIYNLKSLVPSKLDILPPTHSGFLLYVWNKTKGYIGLVNMIKEKKYITSIKEHYVQLEFTVTSDELLPSIGPIKLIYSLSPDCLNIRAEINYLEDDNSQYEIGLLQVYNSRDWTGQAFLGWYESWQKIDQKLRFKYYDSPNDQTEGIMIEGISVEPRLYGAYLPYSVLDRSDRYFIYCYLNLSSYVVMAPNYLGCLPALVISPKGLKKNESYSFDVTYKVFDKVKYSYADVVKWYFENVYSTSQLTKDIIKLSKDLSNRTLPYGNAGGLYPPEWSFPDDYRKEKDFFVSVEQIENRFKLFNAIYNPKSGQIWHLETIEAKRLKEEIKRLQSLGYKIYWTDVPRYFSLSEVSDDKPPFKRWLCLDRDGKLVDFGGGWYLPDWCELEFINWDVSVLKGVVEYFDIDGLYFDTGWKEVVTGYCSRHPNDGVQHGCLRMQYEIYKWLKEKYPEKKVIINSPAATPSFLYADAVSLEGGWLSDMYLLAEEVKPFKMCLINYEYTDFFRNTYGKDNYQSVCIEYLLRNLAIGSTWGSRGGSIIMDYHGKMRQFYENWLGEGVIGSATHIMKMQTFADFSALTPCTPLVIEREAISVKPSLTQPEDSSRKSFFGMLSTAGLPVFYSSLWASKERLLGAVFNDSNQEYNIALELNESIITKYGCKLNPERFEFTVLGKDGIPYSNKTFHVSKKNIGQNIVKIEGSLGAKELLTFTEIHGEDNK